MDNSRSEEQEPIEFTSPNPQPIRNVLVRHPWVLLFGLLGFPLGVTAVAYSELSRIGDVPPPQRETTSQVVDKPIKKPIPTNSTNPDIHDPIPLWLAVAIAGCCSSGCLVILSLLKLPKQV
jgi:hypothetical protein